MQSTLRKFCAGLAASAVLMPGVAHAAQGGGELIWGLPFAGVLLSIALVPVVAPRFWGRRMGAVVLGWTLVLVGAQAVVLGPGVALGAAWQAVLGEYLPFVTLLVAMYAVGGGVLIQGGPWGTPSGNTLLLGIATVCAGVVGPIAVSMVLIHPLLRANAHRERRVHLVVFFIVLVCNVGGVTTPLGNPPLYIGLLQGVPFLWPMRALWPIGMVLAGPLLVAFWLIDRHLAAGSVAAPGRQRVHVRGWGNLAMLGLLVGTVLLQSVWRPGEIDVFGAPVGLERLFGVAVFGLVAVTAAVSTPLAVRQGNMFDWGPMVEVAKLFAGIFVTITPVLEMMAAGAGGALGGVLRLAGDGAGGASPVAYFWLSGVLSAVLDNAPTYYLFFTMAGGDAARLTGEGVVVLMAVSAGSVCFGALTYIGNAPNLMVRGVAAHRGVRMPGFFGYMLYACALLLPGFVAVTLLFFL